MRVLVVEDDLALGSFLKKGLALEGYEVDLVTDGEAALEYVAEHPLNLMVLDLGLPRMDGMDVLSHLRTEFPETAVLVLTGRSGLDVKLRCLDSGADDLLLKPFSFQELTARCRAVLRRRSQRSEDAVLRHQDLEMNRVERRVRRAGVSLDLTVKEFALLEYLLLNRGRCVGRAELLREVWAMSPDAGTNVVDVYVNYLRRKLGVTPAVGVCVEPLIETVRGEGYLIGASVKYLPARSFAAASTQLRFA